MTEQLHSILQKLETSPPSTTLPHLQNLRSLISRSKTLLQSQSSMQIVCTLNQILPDTQVPCSKIAIVQILGSIVDKSKSVTPRALYELDLIVNLLVESSREMRMAAQWFLLRYLRSYMRIDDIFLGYIQAIQASLPNSDSIPYRTLEQMTMYSFQSLVKEQPKCITYCEDNQLLINFIKQLLQYISSNQGKEAEIAEGTLFQLVNSECFKEIYLSFPKSLAQSLKKYFNSQENEGERLRIDSFREGEKEFLFEEGWDGSDQNEEAGQEEGVGQLDFGDQSGVGVQSLFIHTKSNFRAQTIVSKTHPQQGQLSLLEQSFPQKQSVRFQQFLTILDDKENIGINPKSKYLDTSILGPSQQNPLPPKSLFGSAISLFNQEQQLHTSLKQLNAKSNLCSLVPSPLCSAVNSQSSIQPPPSTPPVNHQIQSQLQHIITTLQTDLPHPQKHHYLSQLRTLFKSHHLHYLPQQTQTVLIDTCYDNKLNNCMLAFWGLQHISQLYFHHLTQIEDIQSTCLTKLCDINIHIRNASRKVLYTFGVKRTLVIVGKLFEKYSCCSYYRKREVLQLIAELAEGMDETEAVRTVEYISQHIVGAAADQYRAFLKILYFQSQRFGVSFKKHITKYLREEELGVFNQLTRPSEILLIPEEEKGEVRTVINIDDDGELIDPEQSNNGEEEVGYSFNEDLMVTYNPHFETTLNNQYSGRHSDDEEVCSEEFVTDRNEIETELHIPRSLKKSVSAFLKIPVNISMLLEDNKPKNISARRKSEQDQVSFLKPISLNNQRRRSKRLVNVVYVRKEDLVVPPTPKQIFQTLVSRMKDNSNWKTQYQSLNDLRALFHLQAQFKQRISQNLSAYIPQIIKMVKAQRSSLSKTAIITIQQFCQSSSHQLQPHLQHLLPSLLKKTLSIHDFIVQQINKCLSLVIQHSPHSKIINILYSIFLCKNIQIQAQILYCLQLISSKVGLVELVLKQPKFVVMLQYFSSNQNQKLKSGFTRIVKSIKDPSALAGITDKLRARHYYNLSDMIGVVYSSLPN